MAPARNCQEVQDWWYVRSLAHRETGLATPELDEAVQQYFEGGLAASTRMELQTIMSQLVMYTDCIHKYYTKWQNGRT